MRLVGVICIVIGLFEFFIAAIWLMILTLPAHAQVGYSAPSNRVDFLVWYGPAISSTIGYVAGVALVAGGSRLRKLGIIVAAGILPGWLASIFWFEFRPNADHFQYMIDAGHGGGLLGPIVVTSIVLVVGIAILVASFVRRAR